MNEVRQTFSEEEFKKPKAAETPEIFNLNLIVPNKRRLLGGIALAGLACWSIAIILFFIKSPFVCVAVVCVLIALRYVGLKRKQWEFQSIIELYDDKITIHEVQKEPIGFMEIRDYLVNTYMGFNVWIRLKNGKKIRISGIKNPNTIAFAKAFRSKMEQVISAGVFPIKRRKSFFESKWYLAITIGYSLFAAAILFIIYLKWPKHPPFGLWLCCAYALVLWFVYLVAKDGSKKSI